MKLGALLVFSFFILTPNVYSMKPSPDVLTTTQRCAFLCCPCIFFKKCNDCSADYCAILRNYERPSRTRWKAEHQSSDAPAPQTMSSITLGTNPLHDNVPIESVKK